MTGWNDRIANALMAYRDQITDGPPRNQLMAMRPKTLSDPTATANFLGEKALDKDWSAVALARQMVDDGASPDEIWQATGQRGQPQWFDQGRWWHEAMGTPAADYRQPLPKGDMTDRRRLGDVLPGDKAQDAYPWLSDVPVTHTYSDKQAYGLFQPRTGQIETTLHHQYSPPERQTDTLLHEQQHAIDVREGLPLPTQNVPYSERRLERRAINAAARRFYLNDEDRKTIPPYQTEDAAVRKEWDAAAFPHSGAPNYAAAEQALGDRPLPPQPQQDVNLPPLPWMPRTPPFVDLSPEQWREMARRQEREKVQQIIKKYWPW